MPLPSILPPGVKALAARHGVVAFFALTTLAFVINTFGTIEYLIEKGWTLTEFALWIDQTIINAIIVLMVYMCASRGFRFFMLPTILVLGEILYDKMFLIKDFHSFLNEFDTYRWAFGRHANNVVNPQYGMLVAYFLVFAVLLTLVLIRKHRTFDRMMTVVLAASVIATFTLFHVFLVLGINSAISVEKRAMASIYAGGSAAFQQQCDALHAKCYVISKDAPTVDMKTGETIDPVIARTMEDIAERDIQLRTPYLWSETTLLHGKSLFWVAAVATAHDDIYLAVSGDDFNAAVHAEELQFEFQSVSAHVTWLLIFLGLVVIHRKHSRKTIRKFLPPDAFD
ncbi:hypothetical protein [Rhizobium sp. MHM7A]|uniref:hypothetical protein n=1 Tax=Rhizobium sp. MHM7A TaxID=2583233 RepID=UPI001106368A|nr:hypothetical protein [Rhizobium sp. MHM7A]TLX16302.1 hypothetical protein FFR93_02950 [Rhizobium sp. MHM7A]